MVPIGPRGNPWFDPPPEVTEADMHTPSSQVRLVELQAKVDLLRGALTLIHSHAYLDLCERGIGEAERYYRIAGDALRSTERVGAR